MDCNTAHMLAQLRGPYGQNLDPQDEAALQEHLLTCSECAQRIRLSMQEDLAIARAMVAIPVPPGLKARIQDELKYRGAERLRRRIWQLSAAAAIVLITVGLSTKWRSERKPDLDLALVAEYADEVMSDPRGQAERWLTSQGMAFHPPIAFDFRLMASYGTEDVLPGRPVPRLHFFNPTRNVHAKVFIIRAEQFHTERLREMMLSCHHSGYQVELMADLRNPKQWYVVVYNGADLRAFTREVESV